MALNENVMLLNTECLAGLCSRICLAAFIDLFQCVLFMNKVYSFAVDSLMASTLLYTVAELNSALETSYNLC